MPPASSGLVGPTFTSEFSTSVFYANSRGIVLPCRAFGRPAPAVTWVWTDGVDRSRLRAVSSATQVLPSNGSRVVDVRPIAGLVDVLSNGSLHFVPFHDSTYNEQLHSTSKVRCRATNAVGTIVSKEIQVKSGLHDMQLQQRTCGLNYDLDSSVVEVHAGIRGILPTTSLLGLAYTAPPDSQIIGVYSKWGRDVVAVYSPMFINNYQYTTVLGLLKFVHAGGSGCR